jgi:putative spermidine/putrescine transport system ATP-binding protein
VSKSAPSGSLPIDIRNLTKSYGHNRVLDDLSLEIDRGEFISLLGPSGCGKTTLLMVLAGFTFPDGGRVHFGDRDMTLVQPHRRNAGVVFQNYALFPHMTVAANIAYPLKLRGVRKAEIAVRVRRSLDLVRLDDLGDRAIAHLSGGQKQRVALARAIVFEPSVLLMDEPLSALDRKLREAMQIEIRRLHRELGTTTIYVTHDQREALTMSDRVAVMRKGRLLQVDRPRALYERPANRFVADFVGESFFLPVRVQDGAAYLGDRRLILDQPLLSSKPQQLLAVRPEKLHILGRNSRDQAPLDMNCLVGRLSESVYQGETSILYVDLGDGRQLGVRRSTAEGGQADDLMPGKLIYLGLAPADTVILPPED